MILERGKKCADTGIKARTVPLIRYARRICCLIMAMTLVISLISFSAYAEGDSIGKLALSSAQIDNAVPGSNVEVPIFVSGNDSGILYSDLYVEIDRDGITLIDVMPGLLIRNSSTARVNYPSDKVGDFSIDDMEFREASCEGVLGDGELVVLKFYVDNTAS